MSSQIDHLLNEDRRFAPSERFAAEAVATADLYARAAADREGFWADQARDLHWHTPFTRVLDWSNPPFAEWFPTTPLGKQLLGGASFKQITDSATPIFGALGITPADLLHDIIGDAAVFAFKPGAPNDPNESNDPNDPNVPNGPNG